MDILQKRLKHLRNLKELTQTELALKIGIKENTAKQTIYNYENGVSTPDPETLVKLAQVLECSVDYLLGETDNAKDIKGTKIIYKEEFTIEQIDILNKFGINNAIDYIRVLQDVNIKDVPIETFRKLMESVKLLMQNKADQ